MKVLIRKDVYDQLEKIAITHNIAINHLTNKLLGKMLGNHHEELKDVIENIKERERK